MTKYEKEYEESVRNKEEYWSKQARKFLTWHKPFTTSQIYLPDPKYFEDGLINACYNTIDRHASTTPDKTALIYDSNVGKTEKHTYLECQKKIMQIAQYLKYSLSEIDKTREITCHKNKIADGISNDLDPRHRAKRSKLMNEISNFSDPDYTSPTNATTPPVVVVYMPMSPSAVFVSLACARLGITHNVVFGGYNAESLAMRVKDSNAKIICTVGRAMREKRNVDYYANVALSVGILKKENYKVEKVIVFDAEEVFIDPKSEVVLWNDILKKCEEGCAKQEMNIDNTTDNNTSKNTQAMENTNEFAFINKYIGCIAVHSEHPLFILYTSGSTGKPKGILHTTGGYLLYSALTTKKAFDVDENSIFCCTADLGWITGHTYSVYGPLLLGSTTIIFGGVPTFPTPLRFFEIVQKYHVTHLYTAPTVIRMLQKMLGEKENGESATRNSFNSVETKNGNEDLCTAKNDAHSHTKNQVEDNSKEPDATVSHYKPNDGFTNYNFDLSSLKILGSAGEPINKEAYVWFRDNFGPNLPLIDTYWQTEAGSIMISPMPYESKPVPECAQHPFFGMEPAILKLVDDVYVECKENETGMLYFKGSWPGMARTILNNKERFIAAYFSYPGHYCTGDEAVKKDNLIYIRGRVDDVLNVSGHRLSTAEIESAVCSDEYIVEAAVVGVKDELTGQGLVVFVVKKANSDYVNEMCLTKDIITKSVVQTLRDRIGPIVHPKTIYIVDELPKTRTGKIMRRVLRDLLENKEIGDLSTCNNSESVDAIRKIIMDK